MGRNVVLLLSLGHAITEEPVNSMMSLFDDNYMYQDSFCFCPLIQISN